MVIHWWYAGVEDIRLDTANGSLILTAPREIRLPQQPPVTWQMWMGIQIPVAVAYELNAQGSVSFRVDVYDRTLNWSSIPA